MNETWMTVVGNVAGDVRLTQTATLLAAEGDGTTEEWSTRLRTMMNGHEVPSIELLTRIDALIAGPSKPVSQNDSQALLF